MSFLENAFTANNTKIYRRVQDFLAVVTLLSILSLVLETVPALSSYHKFFVFVEWLAVLIFSFEYLARLKVSHPKWKYPLSFFGIIDLVAILPTFIGLGNFTFLKSARALRIIRMLRMMRLAKMSRRGLVSEKDTSILALNVIIYFAVLLTALLFTGTAMYLVEPNISAFSSIPAGMWWSLKVFMAGIQVVEPSTFLGEIFFVLTRFIGLLLLGLLVGVVGNVFRIILIEK
ncbi:ion transporter [Candidatus Kaiserbacteria bacterium]|nr:ion transporter [Candidatus Kaiserbacteria bacterium]